MTCLKAAGTLLYTTPGTCTTYQGSSEVGGTGRGGHPVEGLSRSLSLGPRQVPRRRTHWSNPRRWAWQICTCTAFFSATTETGWSRSSRRSSGRGRLPPARGNRGRGICDLERLGVLEGRWSPSIGRLLLVQLGYAGAALLGWNFGRRWLTRNLCTHTHTHKEHTHVHTMVTILSFFHMLHTYSLPYWPGHLPYRIVGYWLMASRLFTLYTSLSPQRQLVLAPRLI